MRYQPALTALTLALTALGILRGVGCCGEGIFNLFEPQGALL